jgi:hypothetical protein
VKKMNALAGAILIASLMLLPLTLSVNHSNVTARLGNRGTQLPLALEYQHQKALVADGAPLPYPKVLVADGAPLPYPKVLVADGAPLPYPKIREQGFSLMTV